MDRDCDLPEGAGIFVVGPLLGGAMWAIILAASGMLGCAAVPKCKVFPSGLTICKTDHTDLQDRCPGNLADDGVYIKPQPGKTGCYWRETRTIWVEDTSRGAKSLTHELAHHEGIANPGAEGYNWDDM